MTPLYPYIRLCGVEKLCILFSIAGLFSIPLSAQTISPTDLQNPVPINSLTYGFNGEYMSDECYTSDEPIQNPPVPFEEIYLDPTCPELINEVNPGIVRWPGGITANFYHFYGNGYGIQFAETIGNSIGPVNAGEDDLMPENFIITFADMMLQTNAKVIYTINPYTHFKTGGSALNDINSPAYQYRFKENMDALQYLHDRGVDVLAVEMGNEMYYYPELTSIFAFGTQIDKYLVISEQYTDSIKARWPELKVAVPVAIHNGYGNIGWNNKMKEADFAEGMSIHEYERIVYSQCAGVREKEEYFNCAKQNIERFFDTDFEEAMTEYMDLYPGKELWLTEWGMSQSQRVANTFFDAYFVFKYWNMIAEMQKRYPGTIPYALRHLLIGSSYSYSAYGLKFFDESDDLFYSGNKAKHANAYSHQLMGPLFDDNHQYIGETSLNGHDAWLYKHSNGTYKLAIVNEDHTTSQLDLSGLAQQTGLSGLTFKTHHYLTADDYSTPAGINYFKVGYPNYTNQLEYEPDNDISGQNTASLPGISLNVFELVVTDQPEFSLSSFSVTEEDCIVTAEWVVQNEQAGFEYVLYENNVALQSIIVENFASTNTHRIQLPVEVSTTHAYYLKIIDEQSNQTNSTEKTIVLNCAPVIPTTDLETIEVTESACTLIIDWTSSNDQAGYSYLVEVFSSGNTYLAIPVSSDGSGDYQTLYTPQENDTYDIYISLYNPDDNLVNIVQSSIQITCIPLPEPSFISSSLIVNESCALHSEWSVENDNENLSYLIRIYDEADVQVTSQLIQSNLSGAYEFIYEQEVNSLYHADVEILENSEVAETSERLSAIVDCIPPPAAEASPLSASLLEDCVFNLQWQVSNETAASAYVIWVSFGDNFFEVIDTVYSNSTAEIKDYNYTYTPEENGGYRFQIIHLIDGIFTNFDVTSSTEVSCIPPPEPELANITLEEIDCELHLSWNVIHDNSDLFFVLFQSIDVAYLDPIFNVSSNGSGDYQQILPIESNGLYRIKLELRDALTTYMASEVLTADVNCVPPPPDPEFGTMIAYPLADCQYTLYWSVTNEASFSAYTVEVSIDGGPFEAVSTLLSSEDNAVAVYNFIYSPTQNGSHEFRIDLFIDDAYVTSSNIAERLVDCVPDPEPQFVDFKVIAEANCNYNLEWEVIHETVDASYRVMVSFDGGSYNSIHETVSTDANDIANYTYNFTPEANGFYRFKIDRFESNTFESATNFIAKTINCVQDPLAGISSVTSTLDENCQITIHWAVNNENDLGTYTLYSSYNSEVPVELASIPSSALQIEYDYQFEPTSNGTYSFEIIRSQNGEEDVSASTSDDMQLECVNVPETAFTDFGIEVDEACVADISWSVSNETASNSYRINVSYAGGPFHTVETIQSTGFASTASYHVMYDTDLNGVYTWHIERYESGSYAETSSTLSRYIYCQSQQTPVLGALEASLNEDCHINLTWDVQDEQANAIYYLYKSIGGSGSQLLTSISSTINSGNASYSYLYIPSDNGQHRFFVERHANANVDQTSDEIRIIVNCSNTNDPSITEFYSQAGPECVVDFEWVSENVSPTTSYNIMASRNNEPSHLIGEVLNEVPAPEAQHFWTEQFVKPGLYNFYIEMFDSGELVSTSALSTQTLDCLEVRFDARLDQAVTTGLFNLTITANSEMEVDLQLVRTIDAEVVVYLSETLSPGDNVSQFDLRRYTNIHGTYQLIIRSANQLESRTIIYLD